MLALLGRKITQGFYERDVLGRGSFQTQDQTILRSIGRGSGEFAGLKNRMMQEPVGRFGVIAPEA